MTEYTFKINGTDFSDVIAKNSYATDRQIVTGNSVTTMDGVDHVAVLRNKGTLQIKINPLTAARFQQLYSALATMPVSIQYTCLQTGAAVTETMLLTSVPGTYAMKTSLGKILESLELSFTQL